MPLRVVRRPHTIGGRRIQDILERLRSEEADVRPVIYVAPDGDQGIHIVRYPCSTTEIKVGSALRGETFRPGSTVLLGSHAGEPRLSILAAPPPGQRGSSAFPILSTIDRAQRPTLLSVSPFALQSGTVTLVTFTGADFLQTPVDTPLVAIYDSDLAAWATDPFVSISLPATWIDSETLTASVTVIPGAPAGRLIYYDVERS